MAQIPSFNNNTPASCEEEGGQQRAIVPAGGGGGGASIPQLEQPMLQPFHWQQPVSLRIQHLLVVTEVGSASLLPLLQTLSEESLLTIQWVNPTEVEQETNEPLLLPYIEAMVPDLVLIDLDGCTSWLKTPDALGDVCKQLRLAIAKTGFSTVLVVLDCPLDGPSQEGQRIQALANGADDILTGIVSITELRYRVLAHVRRHLDALLHPVTRLPAEGLLNRLLWRQQQQTQAKQHPSEETTPIDTCLLGVSLANTATYSQFYGENALIDLLHQLGHFINQVSHPSDLLFYSGVGQWVLLSSNHRVDRLVGLLQKRLPTIIEGAYRADEWQMGFHIQKTKTQCLKSTPLLSVAGASLTLTPQTIKRLGLLAPLDLLTQLKLQLRLAHTESKKGQCYWLNEAFQLANTPKEPTTATNHNPNKPIVLIIEPDAALAFLLQSTLSFQGYEVIACCSMQEAHALLASNTIETPNLLLIEPCTQTDATAQWLCLPHHWLEQLKNHLTSIPSITPQALPPIVVVSHNHQQAEALLRLGVQLFIPKPFNLLQLLHEVETLFAQ
jgi:DNA-binding response OmpR family regulator